MVYRLNNAEGLLTAREHIQGLCMIADRDEKTPEH